MRTCLHYASVINDYDTVGPLSDTKPVCYKDDRFIFYVGGYQ